MTIVQRGPDADWECSGCNLWVVLTLKLKLWHYEDVFEIISKGIHAYFSKQSDKNEWVKKYLFATAVDRL